MHLQDNDELIGGYVTLELIRDGKNGPEVIHTETQHNLVVNTGKRQLWRQSMGLNTKVWNFFRIGTSSGAANSAQTNLISPVTNTLKTADAKTLLSGTRTAQWVISYPSGAGTKSVTGIKEVCLFNQRTSPGGSALMRTTFTSVNKTTADKLRITYKARVT
jgi:hypothetical protein